jgi:imidazolonepropionase-like amidohydrolase
MKQFFTPYEALKMATSTNAELLALSGPRNLHPEGPIGVVPEGAYADMILAAALADRNLDPDPDRCAGSYLLRCGPVVRRQWLHSRL